MGREEGVDRLGYGLRQQGWRGRVAGARPEGSRGEEYEFFVWVKKESRDALFLALMDKLYGDRQSCASGFEELMEKNGVPCERFREWRESKTIVGDEDSANRQVVAYVDKDGGMGLQVHDLGGPARPGGFRVLTSRWGRTRRTV